MVESRDGQRCINDMTNLGQHYIRGAVLLQRVQKHIYTKSLLFMVTFQEASVRRGRRQLLTVYDGRLKKRYRLPLLNARELY